MCVLRGSVRITKNSEVVVTSSGWCRWTAVDDGGAGGS